MEGSERKEGWDDIGREGWKEVKGRKDGMILERRMQGSERKEGWDDIGRKGLKEVEGRKDGMIMGGMDCSMDGSKGRMDR